LSLKAAVSVGFHMVVHIIGSYIWLMEHTLCMKPNKVYKLENVFVELSDLHSVKKSWNFLWNFMCCEVTNELENFTKD
jgi:hypothetical protein